jgi:hypothetical protein
LNTSCVLRTCIGTMVLTDAAYKKRWRRLCKGEFASLSKNDTIVWVNEDFGSNEQCANRLSKAQLTASTCKPRGWIATLARHGEPPPVYQSTAVSDLRTQENTVYSDDHRSNVNMTNFREVK